MDYTIYGCVCLCVGALVGLLFGLALAAPQEPTTNGAAYDAMEPTQESWIDRLEQKINGR